MKITFANLFSTKSSHFLHIKKNVGQNFNFLTYKQPISNKLSTINFAKYLSRRRPTLLFAFLANKKDVVNLTNLLRVIKEAKLSPYIKIIAFNEIFDPGLEANLKKAGVNMVTSLDVDLNMINSLCKTYTRTLLSDFEESHEEQKDNNYHHPNVKILPPLNIKEDIFIFNEDSDFTKHLNRVSVSMFGPSPEIGQWEEKSLNSKKVWEFVPNYKNPLTGFFYFDVPIIFEGDQPKFYKRTNRWLFKGTEIKLYYLKNGKEFRRFVLKNDTLNMANNSFQVLKKERIIEESLSTNTDETVEPSNVLTFTKPSIRPPQSITTFTGTEIPLESGDLEVTLYKDSAPLRLVLKLEDLSYQEIILKTQSPASELKKLKGQQLKCRVKLSYNKESFNLETLLKIDDVIKNNGCYHLLGTPLTQLSEEDSQKFYRLFEERQKNINNFINIARF